MTAIRYFLRYKSSALFFVLELFYEFLLLLLLLLLILLLLLLLLILLLNIITYLTIHFYTFLTVIGPMIRLN